MNGNTPYAGLPGVTQAGQRATADIPVVSPETRRELHRNVNQIAALTREYLPDEYVVDSDISIGLSGPHATIAVRPPIGHPVSAGLTPELDGANAPCLDTDECTEVARGLAASAALQVKRAIGDDVTPTAR